MDIIKYYKRVENSKLLFLRIAKVKGDDTILLQDVEVVKMDFEERYSYGINKMTEIDRNEFLDLMNKHNLGIISKISVEGSQRI